MRVERFRWLHLASCINIFIFSFIQTSFNFSLVEFRPVIVHNQWHGVVDLKIKERPFLKFVDLFKFLF